jgi:outer membrane protein
MLPKEPLTLQIMLSKNLQKINLIHNNPTIMKKLSILSFIILVALTTLMAAPTADAQDMRIGFVEPRAILERMPEMRAVQQRLQNFAERKQSELVEKERELQTEIELYQQKVGVISESARQNEEERLTELDQEFRQLQTQAQQEMQEQRQRLMAPLLEQIQESINNVAARRGLDYVLNTTTSTGDVIILYVSPEVQAEYDITSDVMDDLDI